MDWRGVQEDWICLALPNPGIVIASYARNDGGIAGWGVTGWRRGALARRRGLEGLGDIVLRRCDDLVDALRGRVDVIV